MDFFIFLSTNLYIEFYHGSILVDYMYETKFFNLMGEKLFLMPCNETNKVPSVDIFWRKKDATLKSIHVAWKVNEVWIKR